MTVVPKLVLLTILAVFAVVGFRFVHQLVQVVEDLYMQRAVLAMAVAVLVLLPTLLIGFANEENTAISTPAAFVGLACVVVIVGALGYCGWRLGTDLYRQGGSVANIPWSVIGFGAIPVLILLAAAVGHIASGREGYGSDMPALLTLAIAIGATAAMITIATQINYTVTAEYALYNPFGRRVTYMQLWLFYCDEALKGSLFDFAEVYQIRLQDQLRFNAREHPVFGFLIVLYRMFASFIVVGAIIALWKRVF